MDAQGRDVIKQRGSRTTQTDESLRSYSRHLYLHSSDKFTGVSLGLSIGGIPYLDKEEDVGP